MEYDRSSPAVSALAQLGSLAEQIGSPGADLVGIVLTATFRRWRSVVSSESMIAYRWRTDDAEQLPDLTPMMRALETLA